VKNDARVSGSAVVKDYALVEGGQVYDRAVVSEGANVFRGQVYGDAKIHGAAVIVNSDAKIYGNAQVGGVVLIDAATNLSGTAQLLGDGEVYSITATSGVYFGLVDAGAIGNSQNNLGSVPVEVTKPRSMKWYGEVSSSSSTEPSSSSSSSSDASSSSSEEYVNSIVAAAPGISRFNMNNRGIFTYSLGGVPSATLKIFDIRGRLLKSIPLRGSQGNVDVQMNAAQVLIWKVEAEGGKVLFKSSYYIYNL
jgi:hypothetical protein